MKKASFPVMILAAWLILWPGFAAVRAEVATDGTVGRAGAVSLRGPDYDIRPEFGDQSGGNLFHSFSRFSIETGESAVFSGPSSVENIIARVTGGGISSIDGLLRSTIPDADLFLLNPAGILFGPDASLDVGGAFHAGTADYLRMGETERWTVLSGAGGGLSSAPPSAFGFLDGSVSPITVDGSSLTSLGETLSLVGGDLKVTNGAQITTDGGRFGMAAVASPGEVVPGPEGLDLFSFDTLADIDITGSDAGGPSGISVSGGSIFIRGGRFVMENSEILASAPVTVAETAGSVVDIQADSIVLGSGALLTTDTFGRADGADLRIQARDTVDAAGAEIRVGSSDAWASGNAGELTIAARELALREGTRLLSESRRQSTGNAGNVTLRAEKSVAVSDTAIDTFTTGTGNAGTVSIAGDAVRLGAGTEIRAHTEGSGDAGRVSVSAGRSILLTENAAVSTETSSTGRAGVIELNAAEIRMEKHAVVSSSSLTPAGTPGKSAGEAGTIRMTAGGGAVLTDHAAVKTETQGENPAGSIAISAGRFEMTGAAVSSASTAAGRGGDAGTIGVAADDTVTLTGGASLSTDAASGGGGKISATAGTRVYLLDGRISTSVAMGGGDGGDIRVGDEAPGRKPEHVVLNRSSLTANADQGDGGAVFITTDSYFKSPDSVVEATSRRGNDGTIQVTAPHLDLLGGLTVLPANFMDASRWVKRPCDLQPAARMSRFVHRENRDGIPQSDDDWLPSTPALIRRLLAREEAPEARACLAVLDRGDFPEVVERLSESAGDPLHAAASAHALMAMGHYRSALSSLYAVLPAVEKAGEPAVRSLLHNLLGDLHLCLGNLQGAIELQKKAVAEAEASRDPVLLSGALNQMGNVRAAADNLDGAVHAYDKGLSALSGVPDAGGLKAVLLLNQSRARLAQGREGEARGLLRRAAAELSPPMERYDAAVHWISLGMLRERLSAGGTKANGPDAPGSAFDRALSIGRKIENQRILSTALGRQGRLAEAAGRYDAALEKTRRAMGHAEAGYHPEILYQWQWQMGRLSRHLGDPEAAIFWVQAAIDVLNPIRWEYFNGLRDRKKTFDDHVRPVYIELVELLLEGDARLDDAWDTMERLKAVELQNFYQDECVAARIPADDPAGAAVPERTALLYPIAMEDALVVLLRFSDGAAQVRVPVPEARVREVAGRFREAVELLEEDVAADAATLYDWLIRPAEKMLAARRVDTLVIVPDGPLSLIPFAALNDGERYLVEAYAVGVVPSIRLTDFGAGPEDPAGKRRVLLSGLSEGQGEFVPLAHVPQELSGIQATLGGKILLDDAFTRTALQRELESRTYEIVHMATHAVFGESADGSFLLTYDGRLSMDQLDHLIRSGTAQGREMELLTLSACETAVGDERAAFGLAGIALKAGARSALATQWKTGDEAAARVVNGFYRHLHAAGGSKAAALQRAQIEVMRDPRFAHPGSWAAFLVVGNWM